MVKPRPHRHDFRRTTANYRDLVTTNFSTNDAGKYRLDGREPNNDESLRLTNTISDEMPQCSDEPSTTLLMQNEA